MAFIKTDEFAVVQLSTAVAWINGLQLLAANHSGTIGFAGGTSERDIVLPDGFGPKGTGPIQGVVRVLPVPNSSGPLTNLPLSVQKDGSSVDDFVITLVNTNVNLTTQVFEVYVELVEDMPPVPTCGGVTVNVSCGH